MHAHVNTSDSGINWPLAVGVSLGIHLLLISGLPLLKSEAVTIEPVIEKHKVHMTVAEKKPVPPKTVQQKSVQKKTVQKKIVRKQPVKPPVPVRPQEQKITKPVAVTLPVQAIQPVSPPRPEPVMLPPTQRVSTHTPPVTPQLQARVQPRAQPQAKPEAVVVQQRAVLKDNASRIRQTGPTIQPVLRNSTVQTMPTSGTPQKQTLHALPPTQSKWLQASVQPVAPKQLPHTTEVLPNDPNQPGKSKLVSHHERFKTASFVPSGIKPFEPSEVEDDQGILSEDERNRILSSFSRNIQRQIARNKMYPSYARKQGYQGRTVVAFELGRDGSLVWLTVNQSSGYTVLDEAAMKAIRDGSPYDTFPEVIQENSLTFELPISFSME